MRTSDNSRISPIAAAFSRLVLRLSPPGIQIKVATLERGFPVGVGDDGTIDPRFVPPFITTPFP